MKARAYKSSLGCCKDQGGKFGTRNTPRWEGRSECLVNMLKEQKLRESAKFSCQQSVTKT